MLHDAVYNHKELGHEMQRICAARPRPGDPPAYMTDVAVPPGVRPEDMPDYRVASRGCLAAWATTVAFGNKQRKHMEDMLQQGPAERTAMPVTVIGIANEVQLNAGVGDQGEPTELVIDDNILGNLELLALAA